MIVTVSDVSASYVGNLNKAKVQIQVLLSGSIRIAKSSTVLQLPVGNVKGGLAVSASDGIKELTWHGPMWLIADTGMTYADIEIHPSIAG
jgi:hypothetical protein